MTGFEFYDSIPTFADFGEVGDGAHYRPAPDDWLVAASDVVRSTEAIRLGRYKAVNMAGAAVIAAARNALGGHSFPFAFGGDGAVFAAPGAYYDDLALALAAVRDWAARSLDLTLRVAITPVAKVRGAGKDLRIARFASSPDVDYAMFDGGGAAWLEAEMKAGRTAPLISAPGVDPDLAGLSCRWAPMQARHGVILSLIAVPADQGRDAFLPVMQEVLELLEAEGGAANPMLTSDLRLGPTDEALEMEARAAAPRGDVAAAVKAAKRETLLVRFMMATGIPIGGLKPREYRRELAANSDVRKFDDGLKVTADCSVETADRIEAALTRAEEAGICRFGAHRQGQAIMTCLVPDHTRSDHMHFVDGADGGYAMAARNMKAKMGADAFLGWAR